MHFNEPKKEAKEWGDVALRAMIKTSEENIIALVRDDWRWFLMKIKTLPLTHIEINLHR